MATAVTPRGRGLLPSRHSAALSSPFCPRETVRPAHPAPEASRTTASTRPLPVLGLPASGPCAARPAAQMPLQRHGGRRRPSEGLPRRRTWKQTQWEAGQREKNGRRQRSRHLSEQADRAAGGAGCSEPAPGKPVRLAAPAPPCASVSTSLKWGHSLHMSRGHSELVRWGRGFSARPGTGKTWGCPRCLDEGWGPASRAEVQAQGRGEGLALATRGGPRAAVRPGAQGFALFLGRPIVPPLWDWGASHQGSPTGRAARTPKTVPCSRAPPGPRAPPRPAQPAPALGPPREAQPDKGPVWAQLAAGGSGKRGPRSTGERGGGEAGAN